MRLIRVELVSSNYDPARECMHGYVMSGRNAFDVADGYEIEVRDGFLHVTYKQITAVYPAHLIHFGVLYVPAAEAVVSPVAAAPEPPAQDVVVAAQEPVEAPAVLPPSPVVVTPAPALPYALQQPSRHKHDKHGRRR